MSKTESKELKIFELTNKNNGEKHYLAGVNQMDCCRQLGGKIDDYFIVEQKPSYRHGNKEGKELLVRIPCQVCPFQYAECIKPPEAECVSRPLSPDLQEYLKQTCKSHLCIYVGQSLTKQDYFVQQKWCPMEKAIVELTHRR